MRVATADELERAIHSHGPLGAPAALRRYGLVPPIAGGSGLTIDTSTPAIATLASNGADTSISSNSFSPPANSTLAVLVCCSGYHTQTITPTDTLGTHLTYTQKAAVVEGTNHAYAQIWTAPVGSTPPGSMQVIANFSVAVDYNMRIAVVVFNGAAATQNGATATNSASSATPAAPSASLTTTQAGSYVLGIIENYSNTTAPTVNAGQTTTINGLSQFVGANGDSSWAQITSSTQASGTNVTLGDSAPSVEYAMAVVEILAASAGPTPNPQIAAGFFAA